LGIPNATSQDVDRIITSYHLRKVLSTPRITRVRVNPLPLHTSSDPSSIATVITKKNSGIASIKKNAMREKFNKACTDQWITTFNFGHNKGHQFLELRINKKSLITVY